MNTSSPTGSGQENPFKISPFVFWVGLFLWGCGLAFCTGPTIIGTGIAIGLIGAAFILRKGRGGN